MCKYLNNKFIEILCPQKKIASFSLGILALWILENLASIRMSLWEVANSWLTTDDQEKYIDQCVLVWEDR